MKISLIIVGIVVVVAIAAGLLFYFLTRPSYMPFSCSSLTTKPVIVAFGDSLVAGYGAPEQQGFIGPLSTKIGTTILNDGVSGNTTADALQRLPDVLAQHPDIVIVLLGGNDALQQIPLATTQSNLTQILSTLQTNHIAIVLVGVQGALLSDPYAPMFKNLASDYATAYVPNILSGLLGNSSYMYDEVHPNVAGYDKAADKIYPELNHVCENVK